MNKYQVTKVKHEKCKEKMSSTAWKKFAVNGKGPCPVCGECYEED